MSRSFKRKVIHHIARNTGLLSLLSYQQRANLKVVVYHSVSPDKPEVFDSLHPSMHVTVQRFREHMEYLKRYFNFIGPVELSRLRDGQKYDHPLLLTFDDGYKSVYEYALPICEELEIPFIFFVNGSFINNDEPFWLLAISYIFMINCGEAFWKLCQEKGYDIPTSMNSTRDAVRWAYENLNPEDALKIPRKILDMARISKTKLLEELDLFISDKELVEMNGFDWVGIGDHGFKHLPMVKLSNEELNTEIGLSKKRIESILKQKIDMFSFSFSRGRDFDERCVREVATYGYRFLFQSGRRRNRIPKGSSYWIINRCASVLENDSSIDIRNSLYL